MTTETIAAAMPTNTVPCTPAIQRNCRDISERRAESWASGARVRRPATLDRRRAIQCSATLAEFLRLGDVAGPPVGHDLTVTARSAYFVHASFVRVQVWSGL